MRIAIQYYQEVKADALVSAVLDNGELRNEGGTLYKIISLGEVKTKVGIIKL